MAPHCSSAVKLPSRAAETGAHRWSHAIAKGPPRKIRIVHVEEPKVIKTDARQFRELVQRLTGKPSVRGGGRGGGVVGGSGASSSSSSAEIAASESSSSQASGGSSSDGAVVALAAVKAEVEEEEEGDTASPEVEGFAQAFAKVLGATNDGAATTAAVKAEVKEEGDAAWTPEEEGFARGFGEAADTYEAFFHGLDDFLLGAFQEDGCFSL